MPITKNNFQQLVEWKTKKYFMNKGFMPIGEPISIQPSGYSAYKDYYSPYELREMTDDEWENFISTRKRKTKRPQKPVFTAIDLLRKEYDDIAEDKSQPTSKAIYVTTKEASVVDLNTFEVMIYSDDRSLIFREYFPAMYTRVTKAKWIGIADAPSYTAVMDDDFDNIKTIIDIEKLQDMNKLAKLKKVFQHATNIHIAPNVDGLGQQMHLFTFEELLKR